jgi:hypothetical protein
MKRTFELLPGDKVWDDKPSGTPKVYVVTKVERAWITRYHEITLLCLETGQDYLYAYLNSHKWTVAS